LQLSSKTGLEVVAEDRIANGHGRRDAWLKPTRDGVYPAHRRLQRIGVGLADRAADREGRTGGAAATGRDCTAGFGEPGALGAGPDDLLGSAGAQRRIDGLRQSIAVASKRAGACRDRGAQQAECATADARRDPAARVQHHWQPLDAHLATLRAPAVLSR
jgi:hypothetical protein